MTMAVGELAALIKKPAPRRALPTSQEVGMAVVMADEHGVTQVLLDKRARPQGKGDSHSLPHERFHLPLIGGHPEQIL